MPNPKKAQVVKELTEMVDGSQVMVLADYRGMTVADMDDLRKRLRQENAEFHVVKNRLMKIALGDNPAANNLGLKIKGPTGVAFGFEDPVALAKTVLKYADDNKKFELKGAILGSEVLEADGVKALSKMPGLRELRGQLAGSMLQPLRQVAYMMTAPQREVACMLENSRRKMLNAFQNYAAKLEEA
ncbi:50S ribosomal protein L10 [Candidatus Sumerlaeota bacterium]|nr:50S ribosomal protein L10 [Candidatus Sumerlaeota bacterium]